MTSIYGVPINYSGLKNFIPTDEEIIYSSIFRLIQAFPAASSIKWRSHVILTNKGARYYKTNGLVYFTDWGHVSGIFNSGFSSRGFSLKVYYPLDVL